MFLSPNDEEVANSSKNIPTSRLECTNHALFQNKLVEIDTLLQTKTAEKPYPFQGAARTHIAYIRDYPLGRKMLCRFMSLSAYAIKNNNLT